VKYKVWSKIYGKWLQDDYTVYLDPDGEVYLIGENYSYGHMTSKRITDDVEIARYTGLKDRNGKEIYEGDILQYEGSRKQAGKVIFETGMYKALWIKNCPFGGNYESLLYKVAHTCEVIGNIYENPELLGGERVEQS
jgi:uncharacterized phage protein (TIGR01671 family)